MSMKTFQIDLQRYNPDQFNLSFSFSHDTNEDQTNPSFSVFSSGSRNDDDLIAELDTIDFVLDKINSQLSYKDLILQSTLNTPTKTDRKAFILPRSRSRLINKSKPTGAQSPTKSSQSRRLLIPFFTVAKIKRMVSNFRKLKKFKGSNDSPLRSKIPGAEAMSFLNISEDILRDLSEANPNNHDFILKGKNFKNDIIRKVGSWDDVQKISFLDDSILSGIDNFGNFMMKLEPRVKEDSSDNGNRDNSGGFEDIGDENFDFLTNYLGKITQQANLNDTPDYQAVAIFSPGGADFQAKQRVKAFLENYAVQLKDFDFEYALEMAKDARSTIDKIDGIKTPNNHVKGIIETVDKVIDNMFLGIGGRDNFKQKVIDFGDFLRAMLEIGNVKVSEVKEMQITRQVKDMVDEEQSKLVNLRKLNLNQNPNFFDVSEMDEDKLLVKKLFLTLANEILPPRKARIQSPTQSQSFEFHFMSYDEKTPGLINSDFFDDSPKFITANMVDSDYEPKVVKDKARLTFEKEIKMVNGLLDKAKNLYDVIKDISPMEIVGEKEAEKIELLTRGADIVEGYSDCEKRMPVYTEQFRKVKNIAEGRKDSQPVFNQFEENQKRKEENIPVLKPRDILELYPDYYSEMHRLRMTCAGLMHALQKSRSLEPEESLDDLSPHYRAIRESLIEGREVLNTGNPENTIKELGTIVPKREVDLDQVLSDVFKNIKNLTSALNKSRSETHEKSNGNGYEMTARSARNMIEAAIDIDEVIKAAKNTSFITDVTHPEHSPTSTLDGEKGALQREYDASKDKFGECFKDYPTQNLLKQNPVLGSLAKEILKLGEEVFQIHENNPTRDSLERNIEEFIEVAQTTLLNSNDISEIPKFLPSHRSVIESNRLSNQEKNNLLKSIIIRNLKKMRSFNDKSRRGDSLNEEIENLIYKFNLSKIPNLELVNELKEFLRVMDQLNHSCRAEQIFDTDDFKQLRSHIYEANNAIDEIMKLKIHNLMKGVIERSKILSNSGKKLDLDFSQQKDIFTKIMNQVLSLKNLPNEELGSVDKELKLVNATVYETLRNILEAMDQKSKDLIQNLRRIEKTKKLKYPDKVKHIKIGCDDICNNVKSEYTPLANKLRSIVNRVREIEKSNAQIQEMESGIGEAMKDQIDDDVFKLGDFKLDLFDLKDAVSTPIDNVILNTEDFLQKWPSRGDYNNEPRLRFSSRDKDFSFDRDHSGEKKKQVEEFLKENYLSRNPDEVFESLGQRYHSDAGYSTRRKRNRYPWDLNIPYLEQNEDMQFFKDDSGKDYSTVKKPGNKIKSDLDSSFGVSHDQNQKLGKFVPVLTVDIEESFYMVDEEIQHGEKVEVVKRLIHKISVPKGGDLDPEILIKGDEFIEGEDDPNEWESYYIAADERGRTLPEHNRPLFKRRMRRIKSAEMLKRGAKKPKIASTFDKGDVIISSKLVPTDEWVEGKKFHKKLESRQIVEGPLKLKRELNPYGFFINCEGGKPYFAMTGGRLKEYYPRLGINSSYIMLQDDEKSIALIQLAERSSHNPIVSIMQNQKFKSIPLFIKQENEKIENHPVYYHKQFEKLKAHESNGISRHSVWKLDKDPCVEILNREEVQKLVETMREKVPLIFYSETGEEIEGDRVLVKLKLMDILSRIPELSLKRKLFEKVDNSRPNEDNFDVVYEPIGKTVEGNPVYLRKLIKKVVKPVLDPVISSKLDRINREKSIEFLNKSQGKGASRITKPVLEGLSRIDDHHAEETINIVDDSDFPFVGDETRILNKSNKNRLISPINRSPINSNNPFEIQKNSKNLKIPRYPQSSSWKENIPPVQVDQSESESERSEERAERFVEILKEAKNVPDAVEIYKKEIEEFGKGYGLFREMDERFDNLAMEVLRRGEKFDDVSFPPGGSSMVNNTRKTDKDYAGLEWKSINEEIYEKPIFLKKFTPTDLFSGEGYPTELIIALSAMCQWPRRIKTLFQNSEINSSKMFLVKINRSGKWHPILLDDKIPTKEEENTPFILPPLNHIEGIKITKEELKTESKKSLLEKTQNVEIWPLILTKALSKAFLNYERMLTQSLRHFFRNLTGMPVREYPTEKVDFSLLRVCFKRGHMIVGEATEDMKDLAVEDCDLRGASDEMLGFWIVNHSVELDGGEKWIELTHPHCVTHRPKDWPAVDDLKVTEDWRKHRKYKRADEKTIWIPYEKLSTYFNTLTICRYQENLTESHKKFKIQGDGVFSTHLTLPKKTTFMVEILQEDKIFCSPDYDYSKIRLFLLHERDQGFGIGKQHTLLKATSNANTRSTFCEMRLEPGNYKLVADVENRGENFSRKYDLIIHSSNDWFKQRPISLKKSGNLLMETLSNLAIQRGKMGFLNEEKSLRRYVFKSEKIGIYVITYANRSSSCYSILEKVDIVGAEEGYKSSKELEHGKFRISIPSNMKKFIVFRFEGKDFDVEFKDCSVRIRD